MELELFKLLIEKYGILGVVLAVQIGYIAMQKGRVWSKKRDGTYVSWEAMDTRLKRLETDFGAHQTMQITLQTELKERLVRQEEGHKNTEKTLDRLAVVLEKMRDDLSEMKNLMIQQGSK